jgi:hypothetical protein
MNWDKMKVCYQFMYTYIYICTYICIYICLQENDNRRETWYGIKSYLDIHIYVYVHIYI